MPHDTPPRLGFVGFGEAAQGFARGLGQAGIRDMVAYCSGRTHRPPYDAAFRDLAASLGVRLVDTLADLGAQSEVVFSAVTLDAALATAQALAPHLGSRHLLVDINASAPSVKERTHALLQSRGAGYVDAAMMGAVSIYGHKVTIYASGPDAGRLQLTMAPFGMNVTVVGERPGMAATIKMLRSVVTKGMAELLAEAMIAAERAGISEAAFQGICDPMDATTYSAFAAMCLTTDAIHAQRRAAEMDEVIETLRAMGVEPWMTEATRRRLQWTAASGIREHLGGKVPKEWRPVLAYYADRVTENAD